MGGKRIFNVSEFAPFLKRHTKPSPMPHAFSSPTAMPIALQIAAELGVRPPQVQTAIDSLAQAAHLQSSAR